MKKEVEISGVKVVIGKPPADSGLQGLRVLVDIPETKARMLVEGTEKFRKQLRLVPGAAVLTDALLKLEIAVMEVLTGK